MIAIMYVLRPQSCIYGVDPHYIEKKRKKKALLGYLMDLSECYRTDS